MNSFDWDAWTGPWMALGHDLQATLPRAFSAFLLLALGGLCSLAIRRGATRLFHRAGVDSSLRELFVFRVWSRRHPGQTPSQGLGQAVGIGAFLGAALGAAHLAGGAFNEELMAGLLRALPRLFSVLVILLMAVLLASGAGLLAQLVLAGSGSRYAAIWSRAAAWGIFSACALFALEPLGLAGQLLGQAILILLAGAALAAGLAFGLGCKDLARETLLELLKPEEPEG
jgi:hypothetical protein